MNGYDDDLLDLYYDFVVTRHSIWTKRQQGFPQPWTANDVLARRKFTNCFRVLDPGSQFVLTDLNGVRPIDLIARLVFYRITNLPSTWRAILDGMGHYPTARTFVNEPATLYDVLDDHRQAGNRVFSGAYVIMPNPGKAGDKVRDAITLTKRFVEEYAEDFLEMQTQEDRFNVLRSNPGYGKFLSMQVLTDWGYCQEENLENEFVVAGPGAIRGTRFLSDEKTPVEVISDMHRFWDGRPEVRLGHNSLSLMDVQNTFCEFGKYVKELQKPTKKTLYKPAHPGPQPKPVLPVWMT